MNQELKQCDAVKGFQSGDLSLGQLSDTLGKTKQETIKLLGLLNIPVVDYDLEEDLAALDAMSTATNHDN